MKDLQINASSCLWLFVLIAQLLVGFLKGLPSPWAWLFSWCFYLLGLSDLLLQDENIGVVSTCNTPSLKKNNWMFYSCLNFLTKMSSERTTTNMQMFALFSLFHFIFSTSCLHNILIMISKFFLQADQNHADHLCHFLTREIVWSQYRTESQTHRIGLKGDLNNHMVQRVFRW